MIKDLVYPLPISLNLATLLLRVVFCALMLSNHGYIKYQVFAESPDSFPDPLGIGSSITYYLVLFAESVCAVMVCLGLFTKLALVPLVIAMLVALFGVHWDNPLVEKELPAMYLTVYLAIWLLGPGKYSIDWRLYHRA